MFRAAIATSLFALAASVAVAQDNPASQTLITNVHVFDGVNKARVENANVLIEDNLTRAAGFWQEIFSACRFFFLYLSRPAVDMTAMPSRS